MPGAAVTVVSVRWHGGDALTLAYRDPAGDLAEEVLYRQDKPRLQLAEQPSAWRFDGDGAMYRLVARRTASAWRICSIPLLAVHTSLVEPHVTLPHTSDVLRSNSAN